MGKGDKKSKRGKISMGSYGVRRPRKKSTPIVITKKPKAKPKVEAKPKAETKPKAAAKTKAAAKPKATPKAKTAAKEKK